MKGDLVLLFDEYKSLYGSVSNDKGGKNNTPAEETVGAEDTQVPASMFKKQKSIIIGEIS
jgi:hypothetical protein